MKFKIKNNREAISNLTALGYKMLLETLGTLEISKKKNLKVNILYTQTTVLLTLVSFNDIEVEYIYNSIIS